MAEIRQFGTEMSRPIPAEGVVGVQATVIQLPAQVAGLLSREELAERYQGLPIILDEPVGVFGLFFDAHAHIQEHAAEHPILFLVIGGSGYVRVGGADAPAERVHAGYAVLWPAGELHNAWTEGEPMQAITVELLHGASE
ncbi:MAG: cupin domain-containing protein [Kouleothrix sp.]|nr:cupin domain-containing protein [Kouleothrix sp.]